MKTNKLVRYGRSRDKKALLEEIPVVGRRTVSQSSRNSLFSHSMESFEITYVIQGTMEWLINDQLITTRTRDILVTHPNDKLALMNNTIPVSDVYFLQLQLNKSPRDKQLFYNEKLLDITSRKVSLNTDYSQLFQKILDEHNKADEFSQDQCRALLDEILILIIRAHQHGESTAFNENSFRQKLLTYMSQNIDKDIKIHDLAEICEYSESYFRTLFKKSFCMSPADFLRRLRIDSARQLIREESLSLAEIAVKVGFNSSQYFSFAFKNETGLSPRQYRSTLKKGNKSDFIQDHNTSAYLMDMHFKD